MSLEDPSMGATFPSWTSAAEHGAADKMPAWGVPGETPEEGEWPARDRVPEFQNPFEPGGRFHASSARMDQDAIGLRPAEVTEEMIKAGVAEMRYFEPGDDWDEWLSDAYRAMHAAALVPLVSDAERDAAPFSRTSIDRSTISSLLAQVAELTAENDAHRDGKIPEAWRLDARRIERERDAAIATSRMDERRLEMVCKSEAQALRERDEARGSVEQYRLQRDHILGEATQYVEQLNALHAELMAAHDRLAKFTAQNAAETEDPMSAAEVTPEMLKAADDAEQSLDEYTSDEYFTIIYRAMNAVARDDLRQTICNMMVERGAWARRDVERVAKTDELSAQLASAQTDIIQLEKSLVRIADLEDEVEKLANERDDALAWKPRAECWTEANRYLQSENTILRAELAKSTTQNATEAPDPIANAIRPRETDPRRMGITQG